MTGASAVKWSGVAPIRSASGSCPERLRIQPLGATGSHAGRPLAPEPSPAAQVCSAELDATCEVYDEEACSGGFAFDVECVARAGATDRDTAGAQCLQSRCDTILPSISQQ